MKRVLSIIAVVFLCGIFSGCSKQLDLKPSQSIDASDALTTDENVKAVLQGAYFQFAQAGIYGGCLLRNAELLGGDGELQWVGTYIDPRQIYLKTILTTNSEVEAQWEESYQVINTVNNILTALDVVNEADRDRVKGEALFLRGLMYFDLVRFFGQQYKFGATNDQLGVPIVLTPTTVLGSDNLVTRNTVEEGYTQAISDLTQAASLLPEENDVYASKGAADALLARVYLQKGDYADARDFSNLVISSGMYALQSTYAKVFNNDNNTSEDIFATQITSQDYISSMTEFFSTEDYGGRDGDIIILDGHLNLYSPGDQRYDLFFNGNGSIECGKWNNKYGVVNLIRLAEMYLIRAECNLRLASEVGATPLEDFNVIHTRAGLDPASSVTLDDILLERRLELAFEGFKIHDMRRLHEDIGDLPYNDNKLLYPIPQREINANPALESEQNPGY